MVIIVRDLIGCISGSFLHTILTWPYIIEFSFCVGAWYFIVLNLTCGINLRYGHRSLAVREYKKASKELEESVSSVLYGNLTETKKTCTTPIEVKEVSPEPVEVKKKATHEHVEESENKKKAFEQHDGGHEDKKKPFNITINFNLNS